MSGGPVDVTPELRASVTQRIAWLHENRTQVPPVDHRLVADAAAVGDPRLVLHALIAVAGACCFAEDWDGVERYGAQALDLVNTDPELGRGLSEPSVADLHNRLARLGDTACDLPRYLAHTTQSLVEADSNTPLTTTAIFTHNIADACFELGHVGAAAQILAASRVRAIHDSAHKALAGQLLARMSAYEGDTEAAVAYSSEAAGLAAQNAGLARQMVRSAAELCLRSGYVDDAKRIIDGLELATGDATETAARYGILRGQIALADGDLDSAEDAFEQADAILDPVRHVRGSYELQVLRAGLALAEMASAGIDAPTAVSTIAEIGLALRHKGAPVHLVAAVDDIDLDARKRAGDMRGASQVLRRIIARAESRLDPVTSDGVHPEELAASLDRLQARVLADLATEKVDLGSMVAHDLRGVLQIARFVVELGRSGDPGKLAIELRRSARSALRVVETLSLLNSLERGLVRLNQVRMPIADMVEDLARSARQLAASKDQLVDVDRRLPDDAYLLVDPQLFSVVMMNLVSNACKFSSVASTITIRARIRDRGLVLEVIDEGPGIGVEEGVWILQRGAQGKARSDDHGPSLGLGLYIADRVAALLGARITAGNRTDGNGALLHLRFPAMLTGARGPLDDQDAWGTEPGSVTVVDLSDRNDHREIDLTQSHTVKVSDL